MRQKRAVYAEMKQKRTAYAAFEKTVLDLYDQELLTLDQLDLIASEYRWLKLDSAGSRQLQTHDGMDLYQVCVRLVDPSFPIPEKGSYEDHEEYWEQELKKWEDIVRWRWGWYAYNTFIPDQDHQDKAS